MSRTVLLVALAAGCGGGSSAQIDARPVDAQIRDSVVADGPCGSERQLVLRLVDWDSSDAAPMPIAAATFTLQDPATRTAMTEPDGRVEMCVPGLDSGNSYAFDLDAPEGYVDGPLRVISDVAQGGAFERVVLRSFTQERASAFYAAHLGEAFDGTRAHVLVVNACDGNKPLLDRAHGTVLAAQRSDDQSAAWNVGTEGRYVLFPNVDASQPTGLVTFEWPMHRFEVSLQAGRLTTVVACVWYL